ncbi:hypothetical protein AM353_19590 [Providencia stuartii]|nr:hypothetical protein AM353_19590 [Providencia stuartii]
MLNKGNTMHQTVNFPVLPAIEFYQVRMLINKINNFNHNILRAYPNRFLFQTMTPQAKCSIAS